MNYYNYFTELEEHFVRRRGKHLYVSPLDWSLIATWRDSGVPLNVALRGIDKAMDSYYSRPRRNSERPGTLFYCHDTVMAEFARHLESRVGEQETKEDADRADSARHTDAPDKESVLSFLNARAGEIERLLPKLQCRETAVEAVQRVTGRLSEIARNLESGALFDAEALERDLGILDELLVTGLRSALPEETQAEWEQEAKKDLKVYRKRLPKETYQKILENFRRTKTHRHFEIGELSLLAL